MIRKYTLVGLKCCDLKPYLLIFKTHIGGINAKLFMVGSCLLLLIFIQVYVVIVRELADCLTDEQAGWLAS
jgi:hypothetical protein